MLEVGRGAHLGHRHPHADQVGVAEFGPREDGGERVAHFLGNAQLALGGALAGSGVALGHGGRTLFHGSTVQKRKGAAPCGAAPRRLPESGADQYGVTISVS